MAQAHEQVHEQAHDAGQTRHAAGLAFRRYRPHDLASCLALFDANCPEFFAPDERAAFVAFLASLGEGAAGETGVHYTIVERGVRTAGAFGIAAGEDGDGSSARGGAKGARLTWILLHPDEQGRGAGRAMMAYAIAAARDARSPVLHIAASHKSAPFFARFGAVPTRTVEDGWGRGMHRIDMELQLTD